MKSTTMLLQLVYKVIKRQIEMRGDEEEGENYRGPLNATWFQ